MGVSNRYGDFTDSPIDDRMGFDVLFIPEEHRKILNRQPKLMFYSLSNGYNFALLTIDWKILKN